MIMRRLCMNVIGLAVSFAAVNHVHSRDPILVARPDAFKALVNPNCSHCRDEAKRRAADLRANDRVLCWIRGYSDGGAIPIRFFLAPYRVISDTYGVFVYDPDAGFARGFEKSLDFDFFGWRNGVLVLKHKDGTLYSGLTGKAFAGPKNGTRLKVIPTLVNDWGPWLEKYPHAVAYHMFEKYQPVELLVALNQDSVKSRGPADARLPAEAQILGVACGTLTRAYPLDLLARQDMIRDRLGNRECVLLWDGGTRTAAAYEPVASPPAKTNAAEKRLTLRAAAKGSWTDAETGSTWDIAGRATAGPLKDWTLNWLDSTQVRWFAWAAEYPETSIYRK
jgi:hypothetical protein